MKIVFSRKCLEYRAERHPESPERILYIYEFLRKNGLEFVEPEPCEDEDLLKVHSKSYIERVKRGEIFDFDTPNLPNIYEYAKLSAGSAIQAMEISLSGEKAFSLMRPPGHHAGKNGIALNASSLGFCYFNNIAIATAKALDFCEKAAIIDVDYHHGNGTQEIFLGSKRVLYTSLHAFPAYPGSGEKSEENCLNYPLWHEVSREEYLNVLRKACEKVKSFKPNLIGVSFGADTYKNDPVGGLNLEKEDYFEIGKIIADLGKPTFAVMEGGYSLKDLPECVYKFIKGMEK
jgi:acetoin utilization deacetylase AcuC-like enzyme